MRKCVFLVNTTNIINMTIKTSVPPESVFRNHLIQLIQVVRSSGHSVIVNLICADDKKKKKKAQFLVLMMLQLPRLKLSQGSLLDTSSYTVELC